MNLKPVFFILAAFMLGILSTLAVISVIPEHKISSSTTTSYIVESEKALDDDNGGIIARVLGENNQEKASPFDRVAEENIHVDGSKVTINIKDAVWSRFTDTNSMDPVIDYGTNAIQIIPQKPEEIHVGDIVSYNSEYADGTIIHRVIETGYDEKGWYCIMKGDNNSRQDPGKIRFSQIKRIVVAIIY